MKGRMDAVTAWRSITGPRMVLYHPEDAVIQYDPASLHFALDKLEEFREDSSERGVHAVRLGLDGDKGQGNHHNLPLEKFPEFATILSKCRRMTGLTPELPHFFSNDNNNN
jgi:hypothetical protein